MAKHAGYLRHFTVVKHYTLRASEHAHVLEGSPWHDLSKEGDVFLQCGGRLVANVLVSFQVQVRLIDLDDVA